MVEVHYGFGKHEQFLSPYHLKEFQKYTYGEWIQTFATLMFTKVSICLFLIRIPHSKVMLRPLQYAVAFLIWSNTVLTVLWIMQCQPVRAAWDISGGGACLSRGAKSGIILAQAIISVVSDFAFAAFPILLLWKVQIDLKTKIGLCLLMGLGFITGACCLVRTVINDQALPLDESYDGIVNWVWRTFEVQIGIIAACVPTLRPLYKWTLRKLRGEDMGADSNIRFPLSMTKKPQEWVENIRKRSEPSSTRARQQRGSAETEEPDKEGIVQSKELDVRGARHPNHRRNNTLSDDMARYGIGDISQWDLEMGSAVGASQRSKAG